MEDARIEEAAHPSNELKETAHEEVEFTEGGPDQHEFPDQEVANPQGEEELEDAESIDVGDVESQEMIRSSRWKHKSSHPLDNLISPLNTGIQTRSKARNCCLFCIHLLNRA